MPETARIRVLITTRASPDGVTVHTYLAGHAYGPETNPPMPANLAATFLREAWGERCDGDGQDAPAREAPTGPGTECLWCASPYTARTGHGGPVQRFCSDACRAAFHRGARRWAARELEAGRLDIADLREA
jgi:hypothetical protein